MGVVAAKRAPRVGDELGTRHPPTLGAPCPSLPLTHLPSPCPPRLQASDVLGDPDARRQYDAEMADASLSSGFK